MLLHNKVQPIVRCRCIKKTKKEETNVMTIKFHGIYSKRKGKLTSKINNSFSALKWGEFVFEEKFLLSLSTFKKNLIPL